MNTCNTCGVYTRSNIDLCYTCSTDLESTPSSFNKKFNVDPLNYIKGHIAEALIRNLFASVGFKVFKYGIENSLPIINNYTLFGAEKKSYDFKLVSSRPDLFIFNDDKQTAYLIEVKYRNSNYSLNKVFDDDYPYKNALVTIVSNNEIRIIKAEELKTIKEEDFMSNDYLIENFSEFNLDKGLVNIFKEHIRKTYQLLDSSSEKQLKKEIKNLCKSESKIEEKINELLFNSSS